MCELTLFFHYVVSRDQSRLPGLGWQELFIFETESQVAQADFEFCLDEEVLELVILLPPLLEYWDCRHCLPFLVYAMLGIGKSPS